MAVKELLVEIKVKIDKAKQQLKDFSDKVKSTGKQSIDASKEVDKLTKSAQTAGTTAQTSAGSVNKLNTATEKTGATSRTTSGEVDKLSRSIKTEAGTADTAQQKNKDLTTTFKDMGDPIDKAKTGLSGIKTFLGTIGVSVGIGQLITQLKELATAADTANKKIHSAEQNVYYTTGDLTDEQKRMYKNIVSYDLVTGQKGYAGADAEKKISTAIAMLYQANKGASADQIRALANEQLSLDLMGKGELATNIKTSTNMFKAWGVTIDDQVGALSLLRTVSQETGTDFSDLVTQMTELKDVARDLRLSFADTARLIGSFGWDTTGRDKLTDTIRNSIKENLPLDNTTLSELVKGINAQIATGKIISSYQQSINGRGIDDYDQVQKNYADLEKQEEKYAKFNERSAERTAKYMEMGYTANQAWWLTKGADITDVVLTAIQDSNPEYFDKLKDKNGLIDSTKRSGYEIQSPISKAFNSDKSNLPKYEFVTPEKGQIDISENLTTPLTITAKEVTVSGDATTTEQNKTDNTTKSIQEQIAEIDVKSLISANIEDIINQPDIKNFIDEALIPLNDSFILNNESLIALNETFSLSAEVLKAIGDQAIVNTEYILSDTIPAMQNEKTATDNLTVAYWQLYEAKKAAASV